MCTEDKSYGDHVTQQNGKMEGESQEEPPASSHISAPFPAIALAVILTHVL